MNPFEDEINNLENNIGVNQHEIKIEIWVEKCGRKKNTFISGWNIDDITIKDHLRHIKKKKGCNGTVKKINIDTLEKTVVLLQGDHTDYMHNYLISNNISKDSLHIKG
jgi:translation initiation factor 1 (eIF-1/SUI1)